MTPAPRASARRDDVPRPDRIPRRAVWFGTWGGPAATIVAFMLGLMVVRSCEPAAVAARIGLAALAALVSAAALLVARRSWRATREAVPVAAGGVAGRNRFLALFGIAGSVLGVLISLWLLVTILVLDQCLRR